MLSSTPSPWKFKVCLLTQTQRELTHLESSGPGKLSPRRLPATAYITILHKHGIIREKAKQAGRQRPDSDRLITHSPEKWSPVNEHDSEGKKVGLRGTFYFVCVNESSWKV